MQDDSLIGILDLGMGNLSSVANAIYEQGFDYHWARTSSDFDDISHLIIPGVGHFGTAMAQIRERDLLSPLRHWALERKRPTLGICLGMQLFADFGAEGNSDGIGFIPGTVSELDVRPLRIPHVGWNTVRFRHSHPVLENIKPDRDFYFVHSFAFHVSDDSTILATTEYGAEFCCAVARENIVGVQFHPEKSQKNGLQIIENFCAWDGSC